ncbi:MAG: hypothetical protein J6A01_12150 [Proteobacteria bacterium]|nr:hypothetical protein [Pseudomonadota bacterium]
MTNRTKFLTFVCILAGSMASYGCSDDYFVASTHNPVVKTTPECTTNADCANKGDRIECSVDGICVAPAVPPECTTNEDCADKGDKTECSDAGVCVAPSVCDNNVLDEGEECDGLLIAEGLNIDCGENKKLVDTPVCIAGTCKIDLAQSCVEEPQNECTTDEDCAGNEEGRTKCDVDNSVCVAPPECELDEDCAGNEDGRTKCDVDTSVCVVPPECEVDDDCADKEDGRTKCDVDNNVCVVPPECEVDDDCADKEDGRTKCDVDNNVCVVPPECESHEDCADKEDGRIKCDVTQNTCYAPECDNDDACVNNPEGKSKCDVESGFCVVPPECTTDEDCAQKEDGRIQCDTEKSVCIVPPECTKDADCADNEEGKTECSVAEGKCVVPAQCKTDDDCAKNTDGRTQCHVDKGICIKPVITYKECKHPDEDGDGISDELEGKEDNRDTDGDGTPDYLDLDSDGDTIPDSLEGATNKCSGADPIDSDMDGAPDYLDLDSDGNTILDADECCWTDESCQNGKDANGLFISCIDTDGDSYADYADSDNDGDYVSDLLEIVGMVNPKDTKLADDEFSGDCHGGGDDGKSPDGNPDKKGSAAEPIDCDGDGVYDFMDKDSDGDGISDVDEGQGIAGQFYPKGKADSEPGRYYSRYMTDADGDGIPDALECGGYGSTGPTSGSFFVSCKDTLGNGIPDYLELDSDNDGLKDKIEHEIGSNWTVKDTDGDGEDDLAEWTAADFAIKNGLTIVIESSVPDTDRGGTCKKVTKTEVQVSTHDQLVNDPKYGVKDIFDFFFSLPPDDTTDKSDILVFIPAVSKLDVVFDVDTTGSMGTAISNVKTNIQSIITSVQDMVKDSGFGLVNFDDFPIDACNTDDTSYCGYDYYDDLPYRLLGPISTDATTVSNYTKNTLFTTRDGEDWAESGTESMYQIITGEGITWKNGSKSYSVPATPATATTWGGVGFRNGTLPVIVHTTDVYSHDSTAGNTLYNMTVPNDLYYTTTTAYSSTTGVIGPHYTVDLIPKLKSTGTPDGL